MTENINKVLESIARGIRKRHNLKKKDEVRFGLDWQGRLCAYFPCGDVDD